MVEFIMVTPARDEELFLPRVIESVDNSHLKPSLWVIVDDCSKDRTRDLAEAATHRLRYLRVMPLSGVSNRDIAYNYSYVCKKGFEHCIDLAKSMKIEWEYIALLDADTIVAPTYFQGIVAEMEENPRIGIASGDVSHQVDGRTEEVRVFADLPSGTARIWRKRCYIDTDGYIFSQAPDSVSTVRAKLKGWTTVRFQKYNAYQLRRTSSADGLWKGFFARGRAAYNLDYHPILVVARGVSYLASSRFYLLLPFLAGYLASFVTRENKIQDEEVREYFRTIRLKELLANALHNLHWI